MAPPGFTQIDAAAQAAVTLPPSSPSARPPRVKVLIVLSADGYVECYAEDHVDVHFAQRLYVGTQQGETLADELIDATLPRPYRQLFYPRNLRKVGQCRKVSVSQYADTQAELNVLHAIRGLSDSVRLIEEPVA